MHLSPALVSIPMFALPLFTGAAPIPQPDNGGNGGDSYSGAGGNAAGGNVSSPQCDQNGFDLIGLGFLNGNGGNGGSANSGASIAGNGGNGSSDGGNGFGGPAVKLAHYHNSQQGNNNNNDDDNNTDPNGNPDDSFHPFGKNFLAHGKNNQGGGGGGNGGNPASNIINTGGSTVTYVAGAGGNAYSGAGGNANANSNSNSSSGYGGVGSATGDHDFDSLVDADTLNGSNTNVLNNVLGSSKSSFNGNDGGDSWQNHQQNASADSGPAIAGDGGSIVL